MLCFLLISIQYVVDLLRTTMYIVCIEQPLPDRTGSITVDT